MANKEDEDSLILHDMQLNDSFIPIKPSFIPSKPEPRLSIRLPQEINNASINRSPGIITSQAQSTSSSPEIQYLSTVETTNKRIETQRQNSSSSQRDEVHFRGFQTRYSKRKLIKSSLHKTSKGMTAYLEVNREVMLCAWERKLKSSTVSGNTRTEIVSDGSRSPVGSVSSESEFNERINLSQNYPISREILHLSSQTCSISNERSRHPSHSSVGMSSPTLFSPISNERLRHPSHSSVGMSSPTVFSPSDNFRNSFPSQPTLRSPQSTLRSPQYPLEDPRLRSKNQEHIRIDNSSPTFWNPEPPQSLSPPTIELRLRNPDPPHSSARELSPPYDRRSGLLNSDSPPPKVRVQPTYENRLCLTNPDPPSLKLQSSLAKNPFWEERRSNSLENNESMRAETHDDHSIRSRDSIDVINDGNDKQYSTQQAIHINNQRQTDRNLKQGNPEDCALNETIATDIETDETIDIEIARRCPVYMGPLKCHKGDYCEKIHRFPREDEVVCKYFKNEGCRRTASDCWFWHPGEKVKDFVPAVDIPPLVQPMGDLVGYIKKQLTKNPDKYHSGEKPKVLIPSAVGNANHTPMGTRHIGRPDSNYSPLLPHLNTSDSIDNEDNSNIQEPSSVSMSDLSTSSNHINTNSVENSSTEVSRIKRSKPVKVGAPRKKCVDDININNDEMVPDSAAGTKQKSYKIPKKGSVNVNNTSLINEKTSKKIKTVETTETSNNSKSQSFKSHTENNLSREISNDVANEILIKTNVKDIRNTKSSGTRKENQSSKKYNEEKKEKSKEGNARMKSKVRPISESKEDENTADKIAKVSKKLSNGTSIDREEKMQGKKSNKPTKKESKMKRSKIVSSDNSEEDSSQTAVPNSKKFKSSRDESEKEMVMKKSNMYNKKASKLKKSIIESSDESDEVSQENITKNKKSKSSSLKSNKKVKLKKSTIVSEEESEEDSQPLVTKNKKSKTVNNSETDIHMKKPKNHTKKMNKCRLSRIESSNESEEEEVPQTVVTKNKQSNMNVDKQISEPIKDDSNNINIKVEICNSNSNREKQVIIEEITLSDSDDECDLVKSEPFLNEEVDEVDNVQEHKAMDNLNWAICKVFDILEQVTVGKWKRTPNRIEQDLYDVLEQFNLVKFEDKSYPHIYNMDVNYRQVYINILSEVDLNVKEHALLCKKKYPNCKDFPEDHEEDMSCCK